MTTFHRAGATMDSLLIASVLVDAGHEVGPLAPSLFRGRLKE